jgi:hypothetical protein
VVWTVLFHDDFGEEFEALDQALQNELFAHAKLVQDYGLTLAGLRLTHSRARSMPT